MKINSLEKKIICTIEFKSLQYKEQDSLLLILMESFLKREY